ncbi:hypothetical protein TNCV_638391 [Trichonephila clavipes]|nr:hypothetical protein TNCV_638391 [Trichonephila clavipes]
MALLLSKISRYRMAVEETQCSSVPQELQQARKEVPGKSPDFSLDFNFLFPKINIDATARTVTTKLTVVRAHMNSVFGDNVNSIKI